MLEKINVMNQLEEVKYLMKRIPIKMLFIIYKHNLFHWVEQQLKSPKREKIEKIVEQIYTLGAPVSVLSSNGKSLVEFEVNNDKLGECLMKYFKRYPRPSDVYIMFDSTYGTRVCFDDVC